MITVLLNKKLRLWNPIKDLPNTGLILDASDSSSISLNVAAVTQWSETKLNRKRLIQTASTNQPVYSLNEINSKPSIIFDGTNDFTRLSLSSGRLISRTTLSDGASGSVTGKGFTCTGLFYDASENCLWWGNDGRTDEADTTHESSIVKTDLSGTFISQILLDPIVPGGRSIQGVCIDNTNDSLWCCCPQDNRIHNISKAGVLLSSITTVTAPNGLAYDPLNDRLIVWNQAGAILTINKSTGATISSFSPGLSNPDQLFFNISNRQLWLTSGANSTPGIVTVYEYDSFRLIREFALQEAQSIEGLTIINDSLYISNDGYFHVSAPTNELQIYEVPQEASFEKILVTGVIRTGSYANSRCIWSTGEAVANQGFALYTIANSTTSLRVVVNTGVGTTQRDIFDFTVSAGISSYAIIAVEIDFVNRICSMYVNGVLAGSSGFTNAQSISNIFSRFVLGFDTNATRYSNSRFGYLAVSFNSANTDRQKLEGFLAKDFGLGLSSDHPYKNFPPRK